MAKRDVLLRYAQVENEYVEMKELLKELKNDLENGNISNEYYSEKIEIISEEIEKIKLQYLFWSEAIYELKKPNRRNKKLNDFDTNWYNIINTETKKCLLNNDCDPLITLKNIIKEGKLNND